MKEIRSMTLQELTHDLVEEGEKQFRAKQIFAWLHARQAKSFDEMSDLSLALREKLKETYELVTLEQIQVLVSALDGTRKYLFRLPDGHLIESVFMKYRHGNSVCVSSQAGCRMGCRFCASTLDGLARNLLPSEILEQVYQIVRDTGEKISNVVIMGSGEPMDNYENVLRFIRLLTDEKGYHMSQRNITLSTCGIVPGIRRLSEEGLPVTLALSLHAVSDEERRQLMPVARKYPLQEVLAACDAYFEKTGRRASFEYSLVKGVNDSGEHARRLAVLLKGKNCHVNLIPVNPIKERLFQSTSRAEAANFQLTLEKYGINATIRREMGRDIQGACGQLRRDYAGASLSL